VRQSASMARRITLACSAWTIGRTGRQFLTPGIEIVGVPSRKYAASAFSSPSVRRRVSHGDLTPKGTWTGAPGPGPFHFALLKYTYFGPALLRSSGRILRATMRPHKSRTGTKRPRQPRNVTGGSADASAVKPGTRSNLSPNSLYNFAT